ncbi:hypothetical protein B0G80_8589 [Paraburkholderia sp. BL6669N2]|uniref:hypothetical protein n=1 Tax=Paraburkholderia sp. BL6669N2 TaxID=1938807 RepID=UPI000E23E575|nr:hypothetical protein [Paraburkholderia sp. BL6669N2]REG52074.1 hypothetical protein B0G80_8589 [Paraburkholderia sp. BL6669N2]
MSTTERIIQAADLTFINNSLRSLNRDIEAVSQQVNGVGTELADTRSELARLEQAFMQFVAADLRAKELALAETRQIKIRQELETTYGYYAEVRRQATGILQAADVNVVRVETIKSATEGLMLSAPRYWLAPALVALAAWLNDQQDLAKRALAEAVRRDDEKTSLFFALVSRRADRGSACRVWLDRYFGMQDPKSLDRQSVILVDALASGIFGGEVRLQCTRRVESWVEELSAEVGFVETQRHQWSDGLLTKLPENDNSQRYRHLARFSSTWAALNHSLNEATLHEVVRDHFVGIFDGALTPARNIEAAVDDLLDSLVKNFDDEELPLRREDRLNQLIIEKSGDRDAAQRKQALETTILDERVSFTQLLTNAAMNPQLSKATRATQRYATALSRTWIRDAHDDLTASFRARVPSDVALSIEGWTGSTRSGENEEELIGKLGAHLDAERDAALAKLKIGIKQWAAIAFGVLMIVFSISAGWFLALIGVASIGWFFAEKQKIAKAKVRVAEEAAKKKEQCEQALKACLAELVEWRREHARRDAIAVEVTNFIDSISPDQHILASHDNVRRVISAA